MKKIDKVPAAIGAVAAVGLLAVGVPAIAGAASPTPSPQSTNRPAAPGYSDRGRHFTAEKELTGATAEKVKAAVLAKLPGATVTRMSAEDSDEGSGAAYEAHVTKADGTEVEVLLDKNFAVTAVNAGHRCGHFGAGHSGAEKELTGVTADKVKAAVLAKLPGATVRRMSAEDSREGTGAAYEAHVTKADGTSVEVLLDKSFTVTAVNARPGHGFGRGHHGPPPAAGDGANPSAYYSSVSV
ncbi:MAG: PepSY domain-containing protein [Mycobacteriales bacterium]